jgi:antitoxin YefM
MKYVPVAEARQHFSELIGEIQKYREHVMITRNGRPAVMMISFDEWEEITETEFWRAQPGILEDIASAKAEIERGDYVTADELLADARRRIATDREAG